MYKPRGASPRRDYVVGISTIGIIFSMYLCTGFRQDFLPCVKVDTK